MKGLSSVLEKSALELEIHNKTPGRCSVETEAPKRTSV
jgi:hypothetical protein